MDFPRTITIQACEAFLERLLKEEDAVLELPVETKYLAFGGLASAIQAINTWMRRSNGRELVLRVNRSGNRGKSNSCVTSRHFPEFSLTFNWIADINAGIYNYYEHLAMECEPA